MSSNNGLNQNSHIYNLFKNWTKDDLRISQSLMATSQNQLAEIQFEIIIEDLPTTRAQWNKNPDQQKINLKQLINNQLAKACRNIVERSAQ